ncbi:TauD/TfdA family dioxygenase [Streptomyces sp. NPDC001406]|uniref:TauD/TfdA family dioxygenase n=1 Tax=Streptomyces sp. NPDC001406 TaxID=3364572 RepID=UPI0036A8BC70
MAQPAHSRIGPVQPFTGPALWYGPDLAGREDWVVRLTAHHRDEQRAALRTARARGTTLLRMTRDDFPLPDLSAELEHAAAQLRAGRGFVLIRGLPVDGLGDTDASTVLRGVGQYLGRPVPQTADGRTLCHIREADPREDSLRPPPYRTRAGLPLHTDESDLLGLLCLRPARSGGRTVLASAAAVHNTMLAARPDFTRRLYDTYFFAQFEEKDVPGERSYLGAPLITRHGTRASMRYDRERLEAGEALLQDGRRTGPPDADRELFDLVDATAASPAVRLDLDLRAGDLLLVDNHVVLHGRTPFEDHPEPGSKRHLLRLWLARQEAPPAPDGPAERHGAPHTRVGIPPRDVIRPRPLRPAHTSLRRSGRPRPTPGPPA